MLFLASATVLPWLATPSSTQCATYHFPSLCIVVINVYFMHRSIPEKSSYERCIGCISSFKNEVSHLPRLNLGRWWHAVYILDAMAREPCVTTGEWYHCYNRGADKVGESPVPFAKGAGPRSLYAPATPCAPRRVIYIYSNGNSSLYASL